MTICWKYPDGKNGFCLHLPGGAIIPPPGHPIPSEPKAAATATTGNYPELLTDLVLLNSMESSAKQVTDPGVRQALIQGLQTAVQTLVKRIGEENVSISLEK